MPTIVKSGNGYRIETLTSGMQGMVFASSIKVEGNQITFAHKYGAGVMTIVVTRTHQTMVGTYHELWNDGDQVHYPLACKLAGATSTPARSGPNAGAREVSGSKK